MPDHPPPPRLLLLGPAVWCDAQTRVPVPAERHWQLLAWLAHRGDAAGREQVATLFWPGHGAEAARRNLRKVLHRLREHAALPPLDETGGQLRWPVGCDVRDFDAALDRGDTEAAIALWRGDQWSGLGAESQGALGEWLAYERTRLRTRWRGAALQAAEDALRAGDGARAAPLAQRLLDADALDEAALRLRLRALQALGRRHDAEAAYALFARQLAETLGLEPAAETQHLLDTPEAAAAAPAPRDDAAFVGRRQEQRELAALVAQPGCRWVTIVGAGGTGKTTLLRHALPELASIAGVDPLWVSFEDVPSPAAAAQRLAEALGLRVAPQGDALAGVAAQLADRRLLLALDNLEHLADTARALAAALAAGPGVRVVVTSRMRLGVPDEWLLPLQGLPWPGPEDADRAESFDAVRLFNARARRHRPSFNAAAERLAVAQLCAAVEGLPLALAMAAAWTRQFAVADLVAELQRGAVDVLQTAEPGVTPRQASIEACLDHSWQLLVPAERQVLARLTVFAGSFTAESARLVAGATLPLLAALLDKSLVQRTPDDTRRLALHPLTSDFVRRRATVDELDAARRAHAGFFLQQLSHMPPAERPAERAAFFDAAEADAGNLMQAWQHACVHGPADGLAAATVGFFSHLFAQGRFATGLAALRAAEPALAGQPLALARLRSTQALMARSTADLTFAHEALRAALPVARRHRDGKVVRACLSALADVLMLLGRATESRSATREMQRLAERDGDRNVVAIALMSLSIIDNDAGRHAAALAALRRAHAIVEELGQSQASVMQQIGTTLRLAGQPQRAVDELGAFLAGHGHETPAHWRAALLYPMAEAELELGEVDAAAARVAEARAAHAEGHWPVLDIALALLGSRIDLARGRVEAARAGLQQAAAGVRRVDTRPLQHTLALNAGLWLRAAGQVDAAHELLSALLAQPNLATPLRREARSLGARPAADAPPLMPLLERLLPF